MRTNPIYLGDCTEVMASWPDACLDAIVTDPPYGLEFMGKEWDSMGHGNSQQAWHFRWADQALRVLKPGGHLVAFGGTRTYHRLACAIEDAGFEIRDSLHWIYGTGFPKSHDVSKALDKAAGAERTEVVGTKLGRPGMAKDGSNQSFDSSNTYGSGGVLSSDITAPATDAAKQWDGWGTALKPAHEPILLARKPLFGTVAANALAHGTGALNIDGCRVAGVKGVPTSPRRAPQNAAYGDLSADPGTGSGWDRDAGRWPPNILLTHSAACADTGCTPGCPVRLLDGQSGQGGASRFYPQLDWSPEYDAPFLYNAKAAKSERERGKPGSFTEEHGPKKRWNVHPTVKPVALMRWLVRLVTPPGGTVLDPFAGSGTTLIAAKLEGLDALGIEQDEGYCEIARARWAAWAVETVSAP